MIPMVLLVPKWLARLDSHVRAFGAALLFGMLAYGCVHFIYWIAAKTGG